MFSQVSVILSTIDLMDTRSLLILVTARSVRILPECFLVGILATQTAQNIIHRSLPPSQILGQKYKSNR